MSNEETICKKVAELFEGKDWHRLSSEEQEIVHDLQEAGWLEIKTKSNGFIGKSL